jgi:hypothetical protein
LLCLVGTATDPALGMCRDHAIGWLENRRPGVATAIRGSSMLGWRRNVIPGLAVVGAMRRAGVLKFPRVFPAAYGPRRCKAMSKRTRQRCKCWCIREMKTCSMHGARGGPFGKFNRPGDVRLIPHRQRQAEKRHKAEQAKIERQRRWLAGMLPMRTGYKAEKPRAPSLYDQFREGGRGPGRTRDDWNPYS